jgi:hypothetical protein
MMVLFWLSGVLDWLFILLFGNIEKEDEALSKFEALKMQVNLVRNFADQLSKLKVSL